MFLSQLRVFALLQIWSTVTIPVLSVPPDYGRGDVHVKAGQSIQAAINSAKCGSRIVVEAGTYAEQLTITTDEITLVGQGAVLVPPAVPVSNLCSGLAGNDTEAGICIAGSDVVLGPYPGSEHRKVVSVGKPVTNVCVEGFEIHGFVGQNIAAVGARNTRIANNLLVDGGWYGILSDGSTNTQAHGNTIKTMNDLFYIAICTDDYSGVQTTGNTITGYYIGLCIQTSGSLQQDNSVSGCCAGAFVDPGVNGAVVRNNYFGPTDPRCATSFPFNGGIYLTGCVNAHITGNTIEGQRSGGQAPGLALVDDASGAVSSGNVVDHNTLRNNDVDIYVNTTGIGNQVVNNICSTSFPAGLCG